MRIGIVLLCFLALGLGACSHGGGGGGPFGFLTAMEAEPNDSPATATPVTPGRAAVGDVDTAGDLDCWSFAATAGQIIQVELYGTRADLETWDMNDNVPQMSLVDTDGVSVLLQHDYDQDVLSDGWDWGKHDLDFCCFRIPATGTYYLQITQDNPAADGGAYAFTIRMLSFGALQFETEAEGVSGDNDSSATAEPIVPGTLQGFHVDDENDYYVVTITQPSRLWCELKTYRNGAFGGDDSDFDPEIELYDTDGTTQLFNNDDTFFYDSTINYEILTPGNYFINVLECCGAGDARYFLDVQVTPLGAGMEAEPNDDAATANTIAYGNYRIGDAGPADDDWFGFSAEAGDLVRVWFYDSGNSERGTDNSFDLDFFEPDGTTQTSSDYSNGGVNVAVVGIRETGRNYLRVSNSFASSPYSFRIELFKRSGVEGDDPNDTIATSDVLGGDQRIAGGIDAPGDVDVFRFSASAGELVVFRCFAESGGQSDGFFWFSGHGSVLEPFLTILDASSTILAESAYDGPLGNVNAEGVVDGLPTASIAFLAPTAGTYYIEVAAQDGGSGVDHVYVIERVSR